MAPAANINIIKIFFFSGICNFEIGIIGSIKIEKSEMTLKMPVAIYAALTL